MNANFANDGTEPDAAVVNEQTANDESATLSASHPTVTATAAATAAENAQDSDDAATGTSPEGGCFEFLCESLDQDIPRNARSVKVGKNVPYMQGSGGYHLLEEVDMSGASSLESIGDYAFAECSAHWYPSASDDIHFHSRYYRYSPPGYRNGSAINPINKIFQGVSLPII